MFFFDIFEITSNYLHAKKGRLKMFSSKPLKISSNQSVPGYDAKAIAISSIAMTLSLAGIALKKFKAVKIR